MRRALLIALLFGLCVLPNHVFGQTFFASKNSNKYHFQSCQWAQKISPANKIEFRSVDEAYAAGYIPCSVCKPPGRETALKGSKTDTMLSRPAETTSPKSATAAPPSKKGETTEREKTAVRRVAVDTTSPESAAVARRKTTTTPRAAAKKPPPSSEEKTALRKVKEESAQPSSSEKAQAAGQPAAESMAPRLDTILTRFTGTMLLRPRRSIIPQPSQGPFLILADSLHFAAPDYPSSSDEIAFDRWTSNPYDLSGFEEFRISYEVSLRSQPLNWVALKINDVQVDVPGYFQDGSNIVSKKVRAFEIPQPNNVRFSIDTGLNVKDRQNFLTLKNLMITALRKAKRE